MLAFEVETKRGVERVTGLVSQDAHTLFVGTALDFEHLLPLELHQAWVREVKRDGDAGHAVRRKPLFRQPNMRFKADSAVVELAIEPYYVGFEERTFDFDGQIADAYIEQLLVAQTMPGESVAHGAVILAAARGRVKKTLDRIYKIFQD